MVVVFASIYSATRPFNNSLFDYVINLRGGGGANMLTLNMGVLPIFALLIPLIIDNLESEMVVLRIRNKREIFYKYLIFIFIFSAIMTLCMVLSGIVASLIFTGNVENLWGDKLGALYYLLDNKAYFQLYIPHVKTVNLFAYIISSRFFALVFMGIWIILLKITLKKNIYTFIASILLLNIIDDFLPIKLFLGRARIPVDLLLDSSGQLFNLGYFLIVIFILSYICMIIYEKREFYSYK